jgi:hypothetical protein
MNRVRMGCAVFHAVCWNGSIAMRGGLAAGILFALAATASAQPPPTRVPNQPAWYESALRFVPPGMIAGYAVRSDEAKLKGIVPVFPASADDPARPASTFDRGQVLEVELKRNGDALEAASATCVRASCRRAVRRRVPPTRT